MKIYKYFSVCVNFNANFKSTAKQDLPCMGIAKVAKYICCIEREIWDKFEMFEYLSVVS